MKYLKYYEDIEDDNIEKFSNELTELKDFCENYLAYLLDDGFELSFKRKGIPYLRTFQKRSYNYEITLTKRFNNRISEDFGDTFDSTEIENYFIPFIEILKNNYSILNSEITVGFWDDIVGSTCEYDQDVKDLIEKFEQQNIMSIKLQVLGNIAV